MTNQRYVSKELTHFVGRTILNQRGGFDSECEDKQFDLLISILKSGCLKSPQRECDDNRNIESTKSGVIDGRDAVCFCDIPVDDLQIHMRKYSRCGIAFEKEYLIAKGANPAFYIVEQTGILAGAPDRILFLDNVVQRLGFAPMQELSLPPKLVDDLLIITAFLKKFKPMKPDEDPENFYMEREWKLIGNLHFEPNNVCRVIFPKMYARRFRDECPDYFGQITFSD